MTPMPVHLPAAIGWEPVTYAKDQPQYQPLPVLRNPDNGTLISCWGLTWRERLRLALTGRLWVQLLTFGRPLQPMLLSVAPPTFETVKPMESSRGPA